MFLSIDAMIVDDRNKVNNEYYLCPAFNEYNRISEWDETVIGRTEIGAVEVKDMYGLGTPEDVELFNKNNIK